MTTKETMPPLPTPPEFNVIWSALERKAIEAYGQACDEHGYKRGLEEAAQVAEIEDVTFSDNPRGVQRSIAYNIRRRKVAAHPTEQDAPDDERDELRPMYDLHTPLGEYVPEPYSRQSAKPDAPTDLQDFLTDLQGAISNGATDEWLAGFVRQHRDMLQPTVMDVAPLQEALEPHPPSRHCMCADCAPSFPELPVQEAQAVDGFEAWALTCDGNCRDIDLRKYAPDHPVPLIDPDEVYITQSVQRDWIVWKAALASCQPVREALTLLQIQAAMQPLYQSDEAAAMGISDDVRTVRAVEQAHGIAAATGGGKATTP